MKIVYICIVVLCVGMIMTEINARNLVGIIPWAISLILVMIKIDDNKNEQSKTTNRN